MRDLLIALGPLINQSLSAAIATIAASFFLYTLVKDIRNQVARAYSLLLFFVLVTYIGDLGVSFTDDMVSAENWLRFQWLGIAFVPAGYVHVSHAILTMTGLPSRGRRSFAVRALYVLALLFLILVIFTDTLVRDLTTQPAAHMRPGPMFWVFGLYFVGSVVSSYWFILRARNRTLTQATHRRLTWLAASYVAPALSVFPFLLISGQALRSPALFYALLIIVDTILAVMLSYMAYSMAFIGTLLPERLIKAQMLQFFLRGPVVAIAALAVIVWVPRAGEVLGLPGEEVMPLLAVTVILFLQWVITLVRPQLERWIIYVGDQSEIRHIQELEQRLLTGADFQQMLDTILATVCDYLQVETAFVASFTNGNPRLVQAIGLQDQELEKELEANGEIANNALNGPDPDDVTERGDVFIWESYWLIPLHAQAESDGPARLLGLLGVTAPAAAPDALDREQWRVFMALASRAAETLEDRRIQSQVLASIKGMLPEMTTIERLRESGRMGVLEALTTPTEEIISDPDFSQKIKDALSHYWGGPQLTDDSLMHLAVVRQALEEHDGNPQRAMRAVLQQAIENLRPEGQRSMTTAEWILYNILEMRFIQGRKVRDVAMRLAMSESDLYRKQRVAIEAVAEIISNMEREIAAEQE